MFEERKAEIEKSLTNEPYFVNMLCSLPEERYEVMLTAFKLVKLLELQRTNDYDIECANEVYKAYVLEKTGRIALMAFLYGKIIGKREIRQRKGERQK